MHAEKITVVVFLQLHIDCHVAFCVLHYPKIVSSDTSSPHTQSIAIDRFLP